MRPTNNAQSKKASMKGLSKQDAAWTEDLIWTIIYVCVLKSLSMIALLAQPEGHMASLHLPGGVFYPTLPFCTFTTLHRRATGLISDWWAPPPPFPQWNMPFGTSAKVCWVAHARSPNQKTLMCDWERHTHWTTVDFMMIFWESENVLKKTRSAFHDKA